MTMRWPAPRLSRRMRVLVSLCVLALCATAGWAAWEARSWPRRESSPPPHEQEMPLLRELREIALLESEKEGSGRARAKGLVPLLTARSFPVEDFVVTPGTPARWDDCHVILVGTSGSGCAGGDHIGWMRLEAVGGDARAVRVDGSDDALTYVADEGSLRRGEFLAVVRALEVLAGVTLARRPNTSSCDIANWNSSGSLRVEGRAGTLCRESYRYDGAESPGELRSAAAARVVSVMIRSRNLRRFRPAPGDTNWLHDVYLDRACVWGDLHRDRCHGVLFKGLGDSEGLDLVLQKDPILRSYIFPEDGRFGPGR